MSDRPTALHKGMACASMPAEARSAESKQGQVDTEQSDVSACKKEFPNYSNTATNSIK